MAKSLDQLIDFLLEEIALGGDQGKFSLIVMAFRGRRKCRKSFSRLAVALLAFLSLHSVNVPGPK